MPKENINDLLVSDIKETFNIKNFTVGKILLIDYSKNEKLRPENIISLKEDSILVLHKKNTFFEQLQIIVLYMPILFKSTAYATTILRMLSKINWKGKLVLYDVKNDVSLDWIKNTPCIEKLWTIDVRDSKINNVFNMIWDKTL